MTLSSVLAITPVVLACVLLAARVNALATSVLSTLYALALGVWVLPVDWAGLAARTPSSLWLMVEIAGILLGGVLLSELMDRSGAQRQIAEWISESCSDPGRAVILVVLGVTPFVESVTGFGIGVVVAIPVLRHLGLSPFKAAAVGLMGLVLVPWGALGPGTLVAAELGGVDFGALGVYSAVFTLPVLLLMGTTALVLVVGVRPAQRRSGTLVTACLAMWVVLIGVNAALGPPLAGVAASAASIATTLGVSSARDRVRVRLPAAFRTAVRPYLFLIAVLAISGAVGAALPDGPLQEGVTSPAVWLLVTCVFTVNALRLPQAPVRLAVGVAVRRWWPIAAATVGFVALGTVLTGSGMSEAGAEVAAGLGPGYFFGAPFIGAVGGFITGSNTGAMSMLAASTTATADALGASPVVVLAAQNVAASLLTMAFPPRVALAVAIAGGEATDRVQRLVLAATVPAVVTLAVLGTVWATS